MSGRVRALWSRLTGTLWFVPSGIALAMAVLAIAMIELSTRVDDDVLRRFPRIFGASADSSRAMLSAIAGAIITVAGLTFSLTMVAVTQASSQYTPRILRNFMRDRTSQVVLGAYVGTFAYCVLVVRTIRSGDEGRFVPALAVVLGIALAMAGVGALMFFIHHLASGLQASTIVARITHETVHVVDRLFPEDSGDEMRHDDAEGADAFTPIAPWTPVAAPATGYVQAIDADAVLRVAVGHDLVVRLVPAVGDFVVAGMPIGWAMPRALADAPRGKREDGWSRALRATFTVSSFRTVEQDAAFGVRQLVDIALKALSPGVNDTTTATTCIDHIGAILARLAPRRIESHRRAPDDTLRVIAPGPTFASLLALAVDEIRASAASNAAAAARLLAMLELVASCTPSAQRRQTVAAHVERVLGDAEARVPSAHDRDRLRELATRALAATRVGRTLPIRSYAGPVTAAPQGLPRSPAR